MRLVQFVVIIILALTVFSSFTKVEAQPIFPSVSTVMPVFEDDPIASMLDSLAMVKYFERGVEKPLDTKQSKYHFSADSVPRYDAMVYESRLAKLNAESPFDFEYNEAVKTYIELYAVRKRPLVSRAMGLSKLYFPLFEELLDKYNLPLELKNLAIVESAMNPNARSRAGASGLWQFMYSTGKMYDLKVTSYVDERCDPYKSTIAACEYLKFLYEMFGDWQMVLAAYNGGPGTVNKAIRRSGGKHTYWEIRPFLPRETQNYVPAFIAVNYVMNYTAEHNLYASIPKHTSLEIDTVKVKQQISFEQISAVLNIPVDEIKFLNPQYKKGIIPYSLDEPYSLKLPASKVGSFITNEEAIYNYLKLTKPSSQDVMALQEVEKIHTVKKGEHLFSIAKRYKCTAYDIKTWNNLKSNYVKAGQKLVIRIQRANDNTVSVPVNTIAPINNAANKEALNNSENDKYYTIQKGDTLWEIAKKNGVTIEEIKTWNKLGPRYMLLPGHKIKVG